MGSIFEFLCERPEQLFPELQTELDNFIEGILINHFDSISLNVLDYDNFHSPILLGDSETKDMFGHHTHHFTTLELNGIGGLGSITSDIFAIIAKMLNALGATRITELRFFDVPWKVEKPKYQPDLEAITRNEMVIGRSQLFKFKAVQVDLHVAPPSLDALAQLFAYKDVRIERSKFIPSMITNENCIARREGIARLTYVTQELATPGLLGLYEEANHVFSTLIQATFNQHIDMRLIPL